MKILVQSLGKILSVIMNLVTKTSKVRNVSLIFQKFKTNFEQREKITRTFERINSLKKNRIGYLIIY